MADAEQGEKIIQEPKVILELIRYDRTQYAKYENLPVEEIMTHIKPSEINWINLDGLNNQTIIEKLQTHFCLHSLLINDILDDQRPKSEEYEDYLFFTMKMLYRIEATGIDYEQVSFVLGNNFLLSFQEKEGDLYNGFRDRIRLDQGKVRKKHADYLLYRLIDINVDSYYTVLDKIGEMIEDIEEDIHLNPSNRNFNRIQNLKKELIYLRRAVYPLREALSRLVKGESGFIREENLRYFTDVYDHIIHLIDSLDTYKDLTSSLLDIHINTLNTRMNEVMKVLTVISTIFMPLTFIVGVYGMNFSKNFPEIDYEYSYPIVWGIMLLIVISMLVFFKRKKWF